MEFLRRFQEPLTIKGDTSLLHIGKNAVQKENYYTEMQIPFIKKTPESYFKLNLDLG